MRGRFATVLVCAALAGCGGGGAGSVNAGGGGDGGATADAAPTGCPRQPAAADRERVVVISHPYDASAAKAPTYEVLTLGTDGTVSQTGTTFEMGRSLDARIHFTPDGAIGMVAQEDGTLGVFRVNGTTPTVIESAYDAGGAFYASDVVMSEDGAHAFVLDAQWRENGGGIDQLAIDCDGNVSYEGEIAPAKLAYAMTLLSGTSAVVAADDIRDSTPGDTVHLVNLAGNGVIAGADAFGDDQAIVSDATLFGTGTRYFLVGDNSQFSGVNNRIAVVRVANQTLTPVQVLTPIEDPYALVASPDGDVAIAVSGFGNAIFEIDYASGNDPPFSIAGELTYTGAKPQLPGKAVLIDRGSLRGLVLVAENLGVRRVRFAAGGAVEDDGVTLVGSGNESIVGSIGVQP